MEYRVLLGSGKGSQLGSRYTSLMPQTKRAGSSLAEKIGHRFAVALAVRRSAFVGWLSRERREPDAMEMRLRAAPSAGTPMTAAERAALEESRADFRAGNFSVDPVTSHDRGGTAVSP